VIMISGSDGEVYHQLRFLRFLAVAAKGGGFLADYDVFPISRAPKTMALPHAGFFSVYCKIEHPKNAGIPCLMSAGSEEYTRIAYKLIKDAPMKKKKIRQGKNNKIDDNEEDRTTASSVASWSDMIAIIRLRDTGNYMIYDAVLEGFDTSRSKNPMDCKKTDNKHAVRFPMGYIAPTYNDNDNMMLEDPRPTIIRQFLAAWSIACSANQLNKVEMGFSFERDRYHHNNNNNNNMQQQQQQQQQQDNTAITSSTNNLGLADSLFPNMKEEGSSTNNLGLTDSLLPIMKEEGISKTVVTESSVIDDMNKEGYVCKNCI